MSALAASTGALNLGQGFPDEDGPEPVLEAARDAIARGVNQYAPGRGFPDLLSAVAEHQKRFYGIELDPQREVLITVGATEALAATLLALIDSPDDEVVVFEPYYDSYAACVALSGAKLVPVPLRWPDFQPDLEQLASAVTDRTRVILVNERANMQVVTLGPPQEWKSLMVDRAGNPRWGLTLHPKVAPPGDPTTATVLDAQGTPLLQVVACREEVPANSSVTGCSCSAIDALLHE